MDSQSFRLRTVHALAGWSMIDMLVHALRKTIKSLTSPFTELSAIGQMIRFGRRSIDHHYADSDSDHLITLIDNLCGHMSR